MVFTSVGLARLLIDCALSNAVWMLTSPLQSIKGQQIFCLKGETQHLLILIAISKSENDHLYTSLASGISSFLGNVSYSFPIFLLILLI